MSDKEYTPKLTWNRCIICGEYFCFDEVVGGKVKKGGTWCAHKACWEKEQAELAKEAKK